MLWHAAGIALSIVFTVR
jgi:hypothetical protein